MDVDIEIIAHLKENGICRTPQLVKDIKEKYRQKGGIGVSTIYREIARLKKDDKIYSPTKEEIEGYGIKMRNDRDKFLVLRTFIERKDSFDDVFHVLDSQNRDERLRAVREILLHQYKLEFTPEQLDKICDFLDVIAFLRKPLSESSTIVL